MTTTASSKVQSLGNYDSFGNIGSVKSKTDFFTFNGYENFPWMRLSDSKRGFLKFDKNYQFFKFTPAA
jgi:hypothetical protein